MVLHNQNQSAMDAATAIGIESNRIVIEIRQDTKGVLGLEARRYHYGQASLIDMVYSE